MEFWNDILTTALLGTEKRPAATTTLPTQLQEAANQITQQPIDPEEQFLQLAALSFNVRQSGHRPSQNQLSFPQAEAESFPYCSARAAQLLKDILEAEATSLITSWLEACARAQQIAPPELLPILLNKAISSKALRPLVLRIGGRRCEWLSRLNPEWNFSTKTDDEQLWLTGNLDQRKTVLKQMREQDPAKAREWLTQCWPQENANTRSELLKQLAFTVQPEDEPFLQDQLAEKSQKVKDEAIHLLRQLPGSALVKSYQEAAAKMVALKKEKALLGLTTKTALSIQPSPIPAKADYLPGIDYLSNDKMFKDEEFVLYQLIQYIPPAFWEQHLALAPADIIDYFSGSHEKYVSSLAKAIIQFRDNNWARAYLAERDALFAPHIRLLHLAEREAYIIRNFQRYKDSLVEDITEWPGEFSHELAKLFIGYTATQPYRWNFSLYKSNIHRIPVSIAPLLKTFAPTDPAHIPIWTKIADQITILLHLKQRIQTEFNA